MQNEQRDQQHRSFHQIAPVREAQRGSSCRGGGLSEGVDQFPEEVGEEVGEGDEGAEGEDRESVEEGVETDDTAEQDNLQLILAQS